MDLKHANLFRADLSGANLSDADLSNADLTDINMSDADLSNANLSSCVFSRANLSDSKFPNAILYDAKLTYAILSYANLSNAKLSHTNLSYANLSNANLTYATISEGDLSHANLSNANLTCATIQGCKKYNNLVVESADFNSVAINDEGLLEHLRNNHAKNIPQKMNIKCQDTIPPKIISTSPVDGCKEVPIWSYITATFSETIRHFSIKSDSFALYNNGSPVRGTVSLISPEDKTAVFVPLEPLSPHTNYTAVITKVEDLSGNIMESDANWQFTTVKTHICYKLPVLGITANGDDGNIPRNVTDNNLNTRWTNIEVGSWIQMDLGEPKNISNLQIAWFKGDKRTYSFEIILFNKMEDNEKMKKKLDYISRGDSLLPENYEVGNVKARYVRITVKGNSVNNWASITEISICG